MSFYCDHCHFKSTEVQSAGEIQQQGSKFTLKLDRLQDMERQVVKSDTAVFRLEELEVEVPPGRGKLTNLEGVLAGILSDLERDQKQRKKETPELYEKIDSIVQSLIKMMNGGQFPFTVSLDDPAGNSWLEPSPSDVGSKYRQTQYSRTLEQNATLGLNGGNDEKGANDETHATKEFQEPHNGKTNLTDKPQRIVEGSEVEMCNIPNGVQFTVPTDCPGCTRRAEMNIQQVNIPYFREVYITAVVCTQCGYRTSDVKTGGEIPQKGQKICLVVKGAADLGRDILKSETCRLKIPVLCLEVQPGTMGGRFTTVEGLLVQVKNDLQHNVYRVGDTGGDCVPADQTDVWEDFFHHLDRAIRAEDEYLIILEDALGSSYVQSFTAPDPDPQISITEYERTEEEEEELGLADMRTQRFADGQYVKESAQTTRPETGRDLEKEHLDGQRHLKERTHLEEQKRLAEENTRRIVEMKRQKSSELNTKKNTPQAPSAERPTNDLPAESTKGFTDDADGDFVLV